MSGSSETEMLEKPAKIFAGYASLPSVYDEMAPGPGELRPHWKPFAASLDRLGRGELALRWENARRIIREHGVTYNIYGDPQGTDRPWELDMMPLVMSTSEWRSLETALVQRTRLLNRVLA